MNKRNLNQYFTMLAMEVSLRSSGAAVISKAKKF